MKMFRSYRDAVQRFISNARILTTLMLVVANVNSQAGDFRLLFEHDRLNPGVGLVSEYAGYRGSVFFVQGSRLMRLDAIGGKSIEVAVPGEITGADHAPVHLTVVGGALYFQARRTLSGYPSNILFRLDDRFGPAVPVDIRSTILAQYPTSSFSNQGEPLRSLPMVEYRGKLYFFVLKQNPVGNCVLPGSLSLFRMNDAELAPVEIRFDEYGRGCASRIADLIATPHGLAFRVLQGDRNFSQWSVYLKSNLQEVGGSALTDEPGGQDDVVSNVKWAGNSADRPQELHAFGGAIYFASEQQAGGPRSDYPNVGPYPYPGSISEPFVPFEVELSRKTIGGEHVFFDLHATRNIGADHRSYGSSYPSRLTIAHDALYFQASLDGENAELWRISSAKRPVPEILKLNPNSPSKAIPVGAFDDRLWLIADTGAGIDLHYMADDGTTAVPLNVDESVAISASGFTRFGDGVLFSATDSAGISGTYLARSGLDSMAKPKSRMKVVMTTNSRLQQRHPRVTLGVKQRANIRCVVSNNAIDALSVVRIEIRKAIVRPGQRPVSSRVRVCSKPGVLETGRRFGCRALQRVLPGLTRYTCVVTVNTVDANIIRDVKSSFVTGISRR